MPLHIWRRFSAGEDWVELPPMLPGDSAGSFSHFSSLLGERQIVLFECAIDDSASLIVRSRLGVDTEIRRLRAVSFSKIEVVAELADGQPYEMTLQPDNRVGPLYVRWQHHELDFGARRCEVCSEDVPAYGFGVHVLSHEPALLDSWPGAAAGLMKALRDSVDTSMAQASAYPRIVEQLRQSRQLIEGWRLIVASEEQRDRRFDS